MSRSKTRDEILATALRLFNESGTAEISTNHIAKAQAISPGNLYYHFRNKEAIIRELFEQLYARWDQQYAFSNDTAPDLNDLRGLLTATFRTNWDYRFIFRELASLLQRDPDLKTRWLSVRERGFKGFAQLFQVFVAARVLRSPSDPMEIRHLTELIWLISEFWLPTLEVSGRAVHTDDFYHGVELMSQVLAPYVVPQKAPSRARKPRKTRA